MNRKKFIRMSMALGGAGALLTSCKAPLPVKGEIIGSSSKLGHLLLQEKNRGPVVHSAKTKIIIIGAGISGLSAARELTRQGISDFILMDLESQAGGNSMGGSNAVSAYPWGAHYIPTPNNNLTAYLEFLHECGVIQSFREDGLPVYHEQYLCFDPEDRLYINGRWQEGIIPNYGVPTAEKEQIEQFLLEMDRFRNQKGSDGLDAFSIPVNWSSKDTRFTSLDEISMKDWLAGKKFSSGYLHQYVNYCTRDDFGTSYDKCSAWAGIHYFASRKGKGANATAGDLLTWPEGNNFLVKKLEEKVHQQLRLNCLATRVSKTGSGVMVEYWDAGSNQFNAVEASQCIMAVPQFVAARLLEDTNRMEEVKKSFHYSPWMVANLQVGELSERSGAAQSWDNVIYGSDSLGYVDATHQLLQLHKKERNLTYYLPLTKEEPGSARKSARERSHKEWVEIIFNDLQKIHPNIKEATREINIMLWGHAMIMPVPGMIQGSMRQMLSKPIEDRIHFAHTDLSGISIFEEGFYQGIEAAKKVMEVLG